MARGVVRFHAVSRGARAALDRLATRSLSTKYAELVVGVPKVSGRRPARLVCVNMKHDCPLGNVRSGASRGIYAGYGGDDEKGRL